MKPTDEEAPTNEENAPLDSPESQNVPWYKSEIVVKWVSAGAAVLIPIVIAVASWQIQASISGQAVAKDYVGFAISIIEKPKQEGDEYLREWATKLLVRYSPELFSPQAQDQLQHGIFADLSGGGTFGPFAASPDQTKEAVTRTTYTPDGPRAPIPHLVILVYDARSGNVISKIEGPTGMGWDGGGSRIVWSKDGSKLLVCWPERIAAVDVVRGERLGLYQVPMSPSGSWGTKDVDFSPDGLSVTITDENGKITSWDPAQKTTYSPGQRRAEPWLW